MLLEAILMLGAAFVTAVEPLPNEKWWGATANVGWRMPFGANERSLDVGLCGGAAAPLLLSSEGRYVWSDRPFTFSLSNGVLRLTSPAEKLEPVQAGDSLRSAYLAASARHFPFSGKTPPELLFTKPQWNNWIEIAIQGMNQKSVDAYTEALAKSGFPCGVYLMDGGWLSYPGSYEFYAPYFPDPKGMFRRIREKGWKSMIWTAHFVSPDSREYKRLRSGKGYMIDGLDLLAYDKYQPKGKSAGVIWWWSGISATWDLTYPPASENYAATLRKFAADYGIDGFKFDAGDAGAINRSLRFHDPKAEACDFVHNYIRVGVENFPYNEYRVAWANGGQAFMLRLPDQRHTWQDLARVSGMVQSAGLLGYPYVVADMVGGGEATTFRPGGFFSEKLFVRSAALLALHPMMQFSAAPWRYLSPEGVRACRGFAELHVAFGPYIMSLAKTAAQTGEPIVRSMEYEFPHQGFARQMTEFMLGSRYLVAPVVSENDQVCVELPKGTWKDDLGEMHVGPKVMTLANVPLTRLPRYERMDADVVAARRVAEKTRGAGKRGWLAYEAERNAYFPAQNLARVDEIAKDLPKQAVMPGNPRQNRATWDELARTSAGKARIARAEKVLALPIAKVSPDCYFAYALKGDRGLYRNGGNLLPQLSDVVFGECLENKGRFIAKIEALLNAICDEPSWVAPWEGGVGDLNKPLHGIHYIDLTAATHAGIVALATSFFRDRISAATTARVLDTLRGRIFETFLADARRKGETKPYYDWWMSDRFNWGAVCHNGCTTAILAMEDDPRVRAEAIEASERLMVPCFLSGFLADGYCEEGMGYWNYGYGAFLRLAATVKAVTNGRVDFCRAFPRAKVVAGFGARYRMGLGSSPLFADGNGTAGADVLALINQNWPDLYATETASCDSFVVKDLEAFAVLNFSPFGHPKAAAKPTGSQTLPPRDYFDAAEALICRAGLLSFAIKGGSNGDRHNHNDAGSYLINIGDTTACGDPGNENYNSRTFSRRRYESKVLNSFAHPVPRVGGELQGTGPAFGAKLVRTDFTSARDTIVYDLAGAYPAKVPIISLLRTAVFDRERGEVSITDEVAFAAPTTFDVPVIAWKKPVDGATQDEFLIPCPDRKMSLLVKVSVAGGDWKTEEEFVPNPARTQPYRRAIAFTQPVTKAKVCVTYRIVEPTPAARTAKRGS